MSLFFGFDEVPMRFFSFLNGVVSIFLMIMLAVSVSAQTVDLDKLPRYIVVASTNGGVLTDIDVDIRIKKSKYKSELQKLEKRMKP